MKTSLILLLISLSFVSCTDKIAKTAKDIKAIDASNTDNNQYLSGNCGKNVVDEIKKAAEVCSMKKYECELNAKKFRDNYAGINCNVDLYGKNITINDNRVDDLINEVEKENTNSSEIAIDGEQFDYYQYVSPGAMF